MVIIYINWACMKVDIKTRGQCVINRCSNKMSNCLEINMYEIEYIYGTAALKGYDNLSLPIYQIS